MRVLRAKHIPEVESACSLLSFLYIPGPFLACSNTALLLAFALVPEKLPDLSTLRASFFPKLPDSSLLVSSGIPDSYLFVDQIACSLYQALTSLSWAGGVLILVVSEWAEEWIAGIRLNLN